MRLQKLKPNRREPGRERERERIIVMIMIMIIIIRIRILTITMLLLKTLGLSGLGGRGIRERFIHNKDASIFASWGREG